MTNPKGAMMHPHVTFGQKGGIKSTYQYGFFLVLLFLHLLLLLLLFFLLLVLLLLLLLLLVFGSSPIGDDDL